MNNKIIKISDSEYFSLQKLSNSFLINFDRSPAHAFKEKKSTDFMDFGTMVHNFVLEPETFFNKYILIPENLKLNENGTINKVAKENKEWLATIGEFIPVSIPTLQSLEKIKENIFNFNFKGQKLKYYLKNSISEITGLFEFENQECKCKIDALFEDLGSYIIFDLKTTQNCLDFQKSVNNYKYYRQAFFYLKAIEIIKNVYFENIEFYFITIEPEMPFGVKIFTLNSEYLIQGEFETLKSIEKYKNWVNNGSNKSIVYDNGIELLKKPDWLI